ncbi:uncharacterized protein LOC102093723 isoform X2 [Columba livia]|uniref:uncharacterized protein LOC102093723 isoform X2 n=1 Tax=Columba livia TaxID=8932 RepID=UPI0031BA3487
MAADITPVASDSDGAGAGNAVALALLAGATVLLPSSAGFSPRESAGVVPEQKLEGISYSQPQPGEAVANPSYVLITNSCGLTYTDLIQALARSENTFHLCFDPCLACCFITRCRLRMMLLCAAGGLVCHSPEKRSGAIGGLDFEFP